jgi:dihydropyrimidine dehydrogenase (NAD+) subunit PreT
VKRLVHIKVHNGLRILAEQLPPLTQHEALVESNRCLYCYDAPCAHACPTHIDIPAFIKKIATGNVTGSARTILDANLIGATCSRVCPVQELCEGACVLNAEENPIMIGRLQRYAMDHVYDRQIDVIRAAPATGHRVAVVGAGPAGLSCAGELARRGHSVTLYEKRELGGGLSTYGIIVLREPIPVALAEVEMIARLGVKFVTGVEVDGPELLDQYEAVFIATGLGGSPSLGIPGEDLVHDGLAFIEQSKLCPADLNVGASVVVIGAGNTAIDCATVAKRSGAARVTMVYRRTEREMTAYEHEYEFVKKEGVEFAFLSQPTTVLAHGLECVRMDLGEPDSSGRPSPVPVPGSNFVIPADQIIKAIGQQKPGIASRLKLETDRGFIKVTSSLETSLPGIYAGGDCVRAKGAASTVMAAQDGKVAAAAIHRRLTIP